MSVSISIQKQSWPYAMGMALLVHLLILFLLCVQFMNSSVSKLASPNVIQAVMLPTSLLQMPPVLPKIVETQETELLKETVEEILPQPEVSPLAIKKIKENQEKSAEKNQSAATPTEVKETLPAKPATAPSLAPTSTAATNTGNQELDRFRALIAASIGRYWRIPPNLNPNLQALVQVRLAPGGVVLDVRLLQSSGNVMLDQSTLLAVERASPLPVPSDPALFNQFRQIILKVRPEGVIAT